MAGAPRDASVRHRSTQVGTIQWPDVNTVSMTRVPDQFLDIVVYLYASHEDAEEGRDIGGTGFLVSVPMGATDALARYVVTNHHVIRNGCLFVRLNTRAGEHDIVHIRPEEWIHATGNDDIAVAPIPLDGRERYKFATLLWPEYRVTRESMSEDGIGVGDDVVMVGRLQSYAGRQRNQPVARFGNIAMSAGEPVEGGDGLLVEAFLVEMRSQAGFSGAPVFVVIPPFSWRGHLGDGGSLDITTTVALLGVNTGHVRHKQPVQRAKASEESETGLFVFDNANISIVSPAWAIDDVLMSAPLVQQRDQWAESLTATNGAPE